MTTAATEKLRTTGSGLHRVRNRRDGAKNHAASEPLVLLHPFGLCTAVWAPLLPHLQPYHEVHPLSVPGHHGSDPLPLDYRHSISSALDLLEAKLDLLGIERAHVVGNSLGGWLAVELARRGRALSVVAFAPGGGWELGSPEHLKLVRQFQVTKWLLSIGAPVALTLTGSSVVRSLCFYQAVAHPERLSPEHARLLIERIWRCEVYDDLLQAMLTEPPPEPMQVLPCPIQLIWGDKDRVLPLELYSPRWRRVLPKAGWEVMPDVGHLPMFDAPRELAERILTMTCPKAVPDWAERTSIAG